LHHLIICLYIYFVFFRKQALQAKVEAEKEGIVVPLTLEEYCLKPKANPNNQEPQVSN
jgi:ubiquitin-conjugating enzyme E2 R